MHDLANRDATYCGFGTDVVSTIGWNADTLTQSKVFTSPSYDWNDNCSFDTPSCSVAEVAQDRLVIGELAWWSRSVMVVCCHFMLGDEVLADGPVAEPGKEQRFTRDPVSSAGSRR